MKCRLLKLAGLLLLGTAVNVAVAWGCAVWSDTTTWGEREVNESDVRWLALNGERALSFEEDGKVSPITVAIPNGFGITREEFSLHSPEQIESLRRLYEQNPGIHAQPVSYEVIRRSWGLPLRSLSSASWFHTPEWERQFNQLPTRVSRYENTGGMQFSFDEQHRYVLPLRPIWPGFAINTLFYAAVLWTLVAGPFSLRRMIRRRRGRCPACAYPIGASSVCTECGAVLAKL